MDEETSDWRRTTSKNGLVFDAAMARQASGDGLEKYGLYMELKGV
jgi:hypothetical protein